MNSNPTAMPTLADDSQSIMDSATAVLAHANQMGEEREARRRAFAEKQPEPEVCLVAWIDILGFKEGLRGAKDPATFKAVYDKVRRVHEEFSKVSASPEPEQQADMNESEGRRVISLSDGLVVVQSLRAPVLEIDAIEPYGFFDSFIDDLRMAQAQCAYQGIFLRGGIDLGQFWFEDDILLSPGLVEAYLIEDKIAVNPAILISKKLVNQIRKLPGKMKSQTGFEQYRECEWLGGENSGMYLMLDFVDIIANEDHGWHSNEDRLAYQDRSKTGPERDRIFSESRHKQTGNVLRVFKGKLINAYQAAPNEKVRNKYRWMMRYFNNSFPHDAPALIGAAIDDDDPVSLDDIPV